MPLKINLSTPTFETVNDARSQRGEYFIQHNRCYQMFKSYAGNQLSKRI